MFEIEGTHTTATVMGLDEDQIEESATDQIQDIVDHPAFQNPIRVMPDVHVGSSAMIGFTMELGNRIIPNVIGVDIGCGLLALKVNDFEPPVLDADTASGFNHDEIEQRVRDRVPMGWGSDGLHAPNRDYTHVQNEFPWDELNDRLDNFIEAMDEEFVGPMKEFRDAGGYDIEYFTELCEDRAGEMSQYFGQRVGINSVGTLGSGNHFIELAKGETSGDYWLVIHSGSRGLGENTEKYHQKRAITLRDGRADDARATLQDLVTKYDPSYIKFDVGAVSDEDLLDWLQGGKGEDFLNFDAIKADYLDTDPERIEEIKHEFKAVIPDDDVPSLDNSMDWLEGEEAAQYLIDMIFCQEYAVQNRLAMGEAVADELGASITDEIHAIHNFIDFRDQVIRKGATRAYSGERVVVPFNMQDGTLLVEGKSNEKWNNSVSHGAGRTMSRMAAEDVVNEETFQAGMEEAGAFAGAFPLDEAPLAYKDPAMIREAISPTAAVIDHLQVVHNFKADD